MPTHKFHVGQLVELKPGISRMSASPEKASCEACSLLVPPHPLQPIAIPQLNRAAHPYNQLPFHGSTAPFHSAKFCKSIATEICKFDAWQHARA
jgi:hypothetical protein